VKRRKLTNPDGTVAAELTVDVDERLAADAGGESIEDANVLDGDQGEDSWSQYDLTGVTRMFSILPYNGSLFLSKVSQAFIHQLKYLLIQHFLYHKKVSTADIQPLIENNCKKFGCCLVVLIGGRGKGSHCKEMY
jgi:hypothetical protein